MNVAVIGAASFIGAPIAVAFSNGNDLFLVSRDRDRLELVANECRAAGARSATVIVQDLREDTAGALAALNRRAVDILINLASSTSRLRDDETLIADFEHHAAVDLLNPLRLIRDVVARNAGHPLHIIFVSSVLTLVKSPNRSIYSSFKILQEEYLRRLKAAHAGVELTIVRISKVIPADRDSPDTGKLAKAILSAYREKKQTIFFGASGLVLTALFYAQPIAFRAIMWFQRALRGERQVSTRSHNP